MLRSVLSIVAGYLVLAVLVMLATFASAKLHQAEGAENPFNAKPGTGFIVANLIYSGVFAVVGGFLTATIARRAPLLHAVILAVILALLGVASLSMAAGTNEPRWYGLTLIVLGPGCATLGGYLQSLRQHP